MRSVVDARGESKEPNVSIAPDAPCVERTGAAALTAETSRPIMTPAAADDPPIRNAGQDEFASDDRRTDAARQHPRSAATLTRRDRERPMSLPMPPSDRSFPADIDADRVPRVLDAALNRAREGIRVVEDFCRFVLDAPELTQRLKDWRHRLTHLPWPRREFLAARNTVADVGTAASTEWETTRRDPWDIAAANLARTSEALRTLEEFAKLLPKAKGSSDSGTMPADDAEVAHAPEPPLPRALETLRYDLYTLERLILRRRFGERLGRCRLSLLLTTTACRHPWEHVLRAAVAGGVDLVQLREKDLSDARLLALARRVRDVTRELDVPLVINDRPDIAVLVGADGVHVGQDDLPPAEVRRLVGPDRWIGVSTHDLRQLQRAVDAAVDYVGVGPCFTSATKSFEKLAGLDYVRAASRAASLPAFAIGGITPHNIATVLQAGARRVAVSSAICGADDPQRAARSLRAAIERVLDPAALASETPHTRAGKQTGQRE